MKSILIGSRALAYWMPNFKVSPDADWDIISDSPIEGAEFHDRYLLNNDDVHFFTSPYHTIDFNGTEVSVCKLQGLALIKRSHLWRDLSFDKHITHYHKYLEHYATTYSELSEQFLKERTEQTIKMFPQRHPNLNQSVEDFFDDAVVKKYNHDYLHELFAFGSKPWYTSLQYDPSKAWCSQVKFNKLTHQQQLECVAEEVYVIATERFLVSKDWNYPAKLAYMKALKKVCTTLCSGWFRDKAIDHYPEILSLFDESKFSRVKLILEGESK